MSYGAGDYTLDIGAALRDEAAIAYIHVRIINISRAYRTTSAH